MMMIRIKQKNTTWAYLNMELIESIQEVDNLTRIRMFSGDTFYTKEDATSIIKRTEEQNG